MTVTRELLPIFNDSLAMKNLPSPSISRRRSYERTLFRSVSVWIDGMNRQIVMRFREFPSAIFFAFHGSLVRKKLLFNFAAVSGGRNVLVRDHDAVFPSGVFPRVKS